MGVDLNRITPFWIGRFRSPFRTTKRSSSPKKRRPLCNVKWPASRQHPAMQGKRKCLELIVIINSIFYAVIVVPLATAALAISMPAALFATIVGLIALPYYFEYCIDPFAKRRESKKQILQD